MKNCTTYKVRLTEAYGVFQQTVDMYRQAVLYLIDVVNSEWENIKGCKKNESINALEPILIATSLHPFPKYNFSQRFYKFPSYYRRAAIKEAYGIVSSYKSNLANWRKEPKSKRGKMPQLPMKLDTFPCLYKDNTYERTSEYTAKIKVYIRNTWDWVNVKLRKTDVDYITKHCSVRKQLSPTLVRKYKVWELSFPFEYNATLTDTPLNEQIIVGVDMGIINPCTCSVIKTDGTVIGRHFLKLPVEYDSLKHALGGIRYSQKHGSRKMPRKWAKIRNINTDISRKTAQFILDVAMMYSADAVVMERLNVRGKKRGGKKQMLHHWRCQYVQRLVECKCHCQGIRVSHVCAKNTSKLAFDGSGEVLRGKDSKKTSGNYSVCEFRNGKVYNCDLNASYNIGARYFIRKILGETSVTKRLELEAKVPSVLHRSTCCLSDLKDLYAVYCQL